MTTITDHKTLIDLLGGNTEVSKFGDWLAVTVGQWKQQNRIPPEYWPRIIEMSAEKGVAGITSDWLMERWPPRKNRAGSDLQSDVAVGQ